MVDALEFLKKLDERYPSKTSTIRVDHRPDGVTIGYNSNGGVTFTMPTEDYEGVVQWQESEDRG